MVGEKASDLILADISK